MNAKDYAIKAQGSFVLPDVCFKVRQLMEDERSSAADFANVISLDPSMASRLLQIANSAIYNLRSQVSTISKAVTLVGTQAIYNMMLIDVATTAFKHFMTPVIDLKQFWISSIATGLISKNLALHSGVKDIERMFVVGLLHNFGGLIVAKVNPAAAEKCMQQSLHCEPTQAQQAVLGFTYAQVTAELLKLWQIPEKIIIPIANYPQADQLQMGKDAKLLYLAHRLALGLQFTETYPIESELNLNLCQQLKIDPTELEPVVQLASIEVEKVLLSMRLKLY